MTRLLLLAAVLAGSGCARSVRPDEMSADAHRREAAKERAAGEVHRGRYQPDPREQDGSAVVPGYNATTWQLHASMRHHAHAAEHERAADELEQFEEGGCAGIPPSERGACPFLGPVRAAEAIDGGVRVHLAKGAPVAAIAARMRCHLAFARARSFATSACPLMLRGAEVGLGADGAIELTSRDGATVRELRRRAAALVEPAR